MSAPGFDIFDVFSWRLGFVHTGVLQWLLRQEQLAARILAAAADKAWGPQPRLISAPQREVSVGGRAADLGFTVNDGTGDVRIAVETKVEDAMHLSQLHAYRSEGWVPMLYLPGLTGLFISNNAPDSQAREARLTGLALSKALADVEDGLPELVAGYVRDVRGEGERFEQALAHARGERHEPAPEGHTDPKTLDDVAWIVAVQQELQRRHADDEGAEPHGTGIRTRDVAFDRGIFWADSWCDITDKVGHGGVYVDVAASKGAEQRSVLIKAGGGEADGSLRALYELAQTSEAPPGDWSPGRRSFRGSTVTCWRADVTGWDALRTADLADEAARWIRTVT